MTVREKVFQAAERLSEQKPFDQITFAEVAEAAGVHWTAVRRHFGSKEAMRSWLRDKQSARDAHPSDTRTRVLDAAAKVFAEHGYADASLDKAAAYAGMTKGAVFGIFRASRICFSQFSSAIWSGSFACFPSKSKAPLPGTPLRPR